MHAIVLSASAATGSPTWPEPMQLAIELGRLLWPLSMLAENRGKKSPAIYQLEGFQTFGLNLNRLLPRNTRAVENPNAVRRKPVIEVLDESRPADLLNDTVPCIAEVFRLRLSNAGEQTFARDRHDHFLEPRPPFFDLIVVDHAHTAAPFASLQRLAL